MSAAETVVHVAGQRTPAEISMDEISALRGAVLILSRRLRHQLAGDELSPSESAVLARIGRSGPIDPRPARPLRTRPATVHDENHRAPGGRAGTSAANRTRPTAGRSW